MRIGGVSAIRRRPTGLPPSTTARGATGSGRGPGRKDPARSGPHQQRAASGCRPAGRLALDGEERLLDAEPARLLHGGLVSRRSALACFGRGLALSLSKPYLAVSLWLIE